jgi:hypothetical protein
LTIAGINTEAGQVVGAGLPIVSMADLDAWEIDTDDLSEVDVTHTVKIAIEKPDPRLRWGMTGQVEIAVR